MRKGVSHALKILPEQNAPRYFALTAQPIGRQADSIDVDVLAFVSSVSIDIHKKTLLSENKDLLGILEK